MKGAVQYFLGQRLAAVISRLHSGDITSGERERASERARERERERERDGGEYIFISNYKKKKKFRE